METSPSVPDVQGVWMTVINQQQGSHPLHMLKGTLFINIAQGKQDILGTPLSCWCSFLLVALCFRGKFSQEEKFR